MWVKCATSAECKSIRIAASAVMDGWKGPTGRLGKEVVLKRKVFMWNKEVPGRYEVWEKMIGLGETISPISRKEKGVSPS